MPRIKNASGLRRYVILSGTEIHSFSANERSVETHKLTRDFYFTENDIIRSPKSRDDYVRVALNRGIWTWLDVACTDILQVKLTPIDKSEI